MKEFLRENPWVKWATGFALVALIIVVNLVDRGGEPAPAAPGDDTQVTTSPATETDEVTATAEPTSEPTPEPTPEPPTETEESAETEDPPDPTTAEATTSEPPEEATNEAAPGFGGEPDDREPSGIPWNEDEDGRPDISAEQDHAAMHVDGTPQYAAYQYTAMVNSMSPDDETPYEHLERARPYMTEKLFTEQYELAKSAWVDPSASDLEWWEMFTAGGVAYDADEIYVTTSAHAEQTESELWFHVDYFPVSPFGGERVKQDETARTVVVVKEGDRWLVSAELLPSD